ncbi:MAG TPA: hypothetical protein ENI95_02535 [Chloroflexi bacterium]|nr:hypothetical protein [Chloroflexota bacterium]
MRPVPTRSRSAASKGKRPAPGFPALRLPGLLLLIGLALAACRGSKTPEVPPTLTPSPTPWPTLAPVLTPVPTPTGTATEDQGPQLVDKFRAVVQEGLVSVFPLEGNIERPVRVEVIVLSGDIDPVITIDNAAGDRLAHADSGGAGEPEVIGQFQFPGDGFYELGLTTNSGSGEVGVSIYSLDPAEMEGGGVFTSLDEELRGTMEHPATYHTFRLPVQRGQRFDLSATALDEGLDLLFELYGPDGALLAARDDNVGLDPYLWNFMPSQSGTYTVVLSNYGEGVGDYVLRVSPSESGGAAAIGVRTDLEVSAVPRRSTWLTLEGRTLDAVRVEVRPIDPGIDPTIAIYDPYGNRLTAVDQFGPDQPEQLTLVQFPFDGEYQVEFMTLGEGGQIEYFIRPIRQVDIEMGGKRITPGRFAHEGEIVGPGTVFTYLFDAEAGDLIGVDAHGTDNSGLDLGFDLFAPDGSLLVTRDDTVGLNPVIDRLELPQSGQYALALWNYGGTTGPYELFVTNPEAPATPPGPSLTEEAP